MEAVILAAGRGQRMVGVAKPFYKPLLEVNGLSLLAHSAEYAAAAGIERAVVVASPHNVDDIEHALDACSIKTTIMIQHDPSGPGHAALVGLSAIHSERCMLLLSDNIMDKTAVVSMVNKCKQEDANAVAICDVDRAQASRFTRIRNNVNGLYSYEETTPITDEDLWEPNGNIVKVWCGPLIFDTRRAIGALSTVENTAGELKIGPHLTKIMRSPTLLVDVNAMDVGIPLAYESVTQ